MENTEVKNEVTNSPEIYLAKSQLMSMGKQIGLAWSRFCMVVIAVLVLLIVIDYFRTDQIHSITLTVLGAAVTCMGFVWGAKGISNFAPAKKEPLPEAPLVIKHQEQDSTDSTNSDQTRMR